eukprot:gene12874-14199_t
MTCQIQIVVNGSDVGNVTTSALANISNLLRNASICLQQQSTVVSSTKTTNMTDDSGDATWILTSAFIIFTMQSGFGLLEAGLVSAKNECNIMIKNMVDVIFGGLAYWLFGFGLSFGNDAGSNGFTGVGSFLTDAGHNDMGHLFARFFFQLSFATTATTIVSGAMAERTNLEAYMVYSFINVFTYVFPAHWMWSEKGFLKQMGAIDIAGGGPVHLVGGFAALVATLYLKPRSGKFDPGYNLEMASPTNAVLGTFMLWWGWLGFNCGSTFGVTEGRWKLAARASINTINGSIGGAMFAILYSCRLNKKYKRKLNVPMFTSGILGGLVGITAICTICRPWEALIIGFIGGVLSCTGMDFLEWMKIDDPVGCIPVHGITGIWGLIAVGLFAEKVPHGGSVISPGLFKGGNAKFLGVQVVACICIIAWSATTTIIELFIADKLFGLRVTLEEEMLGADYCEHGILPRSTPESELLSELKQRSSKQSDFGRSKIHVEVQTQVTKRTDWHVNVAFQNENEANEREENTTSRKNSSTDIPRVENSNTADRHGNEIMHSHR